MSDMEDGSRLKQLSKDIAAVCKSVLETDAITIVERHGQTYADEDGSGQYAAIVGVRHTYTIVRYEVRHLFGWRWLKYEKHHPLVRIGGEHTYGSPYLIWPFCTVFDERLATPVRALFERVERSSNTLPYRNREGESFVVESKGG